MKSDIHIYINKKCNLDCSYCYVKLDNKTLPLDINKLFKNYKIADYKNIHFLGGEPLMNFELIAGIIQKLKKTKKNNHFIIHTNGILLNSNTLEYFNNNGAELNISLHFNNLDKILSENKLQLYKKFKDMIIFNIIFTPEYFDKVIPLVDKLKENGLFKIVIYPNVNAFWTKGDIKKIDEIFLHLKSLAKTNNLIDFIGINGFELRNIGVICKDDIINPSSEKIKCNRLLNSDGNIDIDEVYKKFTEINKCNSCVDKWFCACPVGFLIDNKNEDKGLILQKFNNFHLINKKFISFFRDFSAIRKKVNFLNENINELRLNLTDNCNLNCRYCYVNKGNNSMDLEKLKNILNWFIYGKQKNKIISFFGGEPLMKFDLVKDIVSFIKENKSKIRYKIATNLTLIDFEIIEFLKENDFEIHVSCNGNPEINNYLRDNSHKKFLSGLNKLKSKVDIKNTVVLFGFSRKQINNIFDNILYLYNLGFRQINFEILYLDNEILTIDDYLNLKFQISKLSKILKDKIKIYNLGKKNMSMDISANLEIGENSFKFNNKTVDFSPKIILDKLINLYF